MTQPPLQPPEPTDGFPHQPARESSQPPLPPGDTTQHTAPLWYDQTQTQPQYPAYPPEFTEPGSGPAALPQPEPGREAAQPARPRRFVDLIAVAALAAILSSAGTYAVVRGDLAASPAASPVGQSRTNTNTNTNVQAPVVQANPSAPNWAVTAAAVSPSVVAISVENGQSGGQGSGVIYDAKGHILTNNHVVTAGGQGAEISVTLNDKRTFDATIVGTDPSSDLAVISLTAPPNDLKPIALGDANTLKVGEPTMAVGNPLGLAGTVTTGIVSALDRPVTTSARSSGEPFAQPGEPVVTNAVQTSAAINPGNSGGALVNGGGQLIGINSAIATLGSGGSSQSGSIGIGFAIPVNESKSVADQLIATGKATHGFLGVTPRDAIVTDGPAKRPAAVAAQIASDTPADRAGLEVGDAIIAVDGEPIDGALSLVAQVRERTAGDKIALTVIRDGKTMQVSVTLVGRPVTG